MKLNANVAALLFTGIGATFTASLPSSVYALSISNGSFESGINLGQFVQLNAVDSSSINNWTVRNNSVDYINTLWTAADGLRSIDLSGAGAGTLETIFNVGAGDVGILQTILFDLASNNGDNANTTKNLTVSVNGQNITPYSITATSANPGTPGNSWTTFSYTFTPTGVGNSTLSFTSLTPGFFGPALDNVRVQPVPFEFSPLSLIGVGAALLVRSKFSSKKKAQ